MTFLTVGDPVPWFTIASTSNPSYNFDTVGGYRTILFFFGSYQNRAVQEVLNCFCASQERLAALGTPFFGVSINPADQALVDRIVIPTYFKFLWDFDAKVSQRYGVCQATSESSNSTAASISGWQYTPTTLVLDENLRVLGVFPLKATDTHVEQVLEFVSQIPAIEPTRIASRQAPVLFIPRVFDRDFCRHLINLYEQDGGRDSGFMRQIDGKTVEVYDYDFKKRRDFLIEEPTLLETVNNLIVRRVKPEIEKIFQFTITRFERHLVACYEANDRGFFNRHRDNTTKGTAHRRFAMSLNLNAEEYEGGYLRFPEYGSQLYRPDTGEAIIFSCSMLHEAIPVTSGRRFVLLSFFYNDEDAQLRSRNQKYVVTDSKPSTTIQPPEVTSSRKSSLGFQSKVKKKR